MKRLQNEKLGTLQLHKAKKQVLGQLAISGESNEQVMLTNAKSLLVYNTIDSMETIAAKINAITSEKLLDIANEIFDTSTLSSLTYN